jgi:hypothetical protein
VERRSWERFRVASLTVALQSQNEYGEVFVRYGSRASATLLAGDASQEGAHNGGFTA